MAKPAFIYAFDNLDPDKFTELCGELLGARYKGFGYLVMGGVGADGGIDAELDTNWAIWRPEEREEFLEDIIEPGRNILFQFKHKVVARAGGQSNARAQLLDLFKCTKSYKCELHRSLIEERKPTDYVLVTNVEVNSNFRTKFIDRCHSENSDIPHYQVIGLDELESWITLEPRLRHLYFPTIFGPPRFELQIRANPCIMGHPLRPSETVSGLTVSILNIGSLPSFVDLVRFGILVESQEMSFQTLDFNDEIMRFNPRPGTEIKPGQKLTYRYPRYALINMQEEGKEVFPFEIVVADEIGNEYRMPISEDLRHWMFAPSTVESDK
jgi:hypothetical protein